MLTHEKSAHALRRSRNRTVLETSIAAIDCCDKVLSCWILYECMCYVSFLHNVCDHEYKGSTAISFTLLCATLSS